LKIKRKFKSTTFDLCGKRAANRHVNDDYYYYYDDDDDDNNYDNYDYY